MKITRAFAEKVIERLEDSESLFLKRGRASNQPVELVNELGVDPTPNEVQYEQIPEPHPEPTPPELNHEPNPAKENPEPNPPQPNPRQDIEDWFPTFRELVQGRKIFYLTLLSKLLGNHKIRMKRLVLL